MGLLKKLTIMLGSLKKFLKLLKAALCNIYFLFYGIVYQQVDGVAMGSPSGPSLANAFLAHYEQMIVWMSLNLYTIKDMWMIYLFYFDLRTTLKNLMNI